jgi:hypothetical protein
MVGKWGLKKSRQSAPRRVLAGFAQGKTDHLPHAG